MGWGFVTTARRLALFSGVLVLPWWVVSCSSSGQARLAGDRSPAPSAYGATASVGGQQLVPAVPRKSPSALYREVNVKRDLIPRGRYARKYRRPMRPRYITIHSTQNFSRNADAWRHSEALKNGKLRAHKRRGGNRIGYLVWHYTIDEHRAVQHLPTHEQGEHADFDGPGNRYSIGLEMCEHRGNSRSATVERTAKLTAWLMHRHSIPLRKVVPHYHWPRRGCNPAHKNCPHFLMDNGHPGAKWQWFLAKVNRYYKEISTPVPQVIPRPAAPSRPAVPSSYGVRVASVTPARAPRVRPAGYEPRAARRPTPERAKVVRKKPVHRATVRYHTVRRGDTLYGLSRRYKTTVSAIQRANGLRGTVISIGKRLRIPTT